MLSGAVRTLPLPWETYGEYHDTSCPNQSRFRLPFRKRLIIGYLEARAAARIGKKIAGLEAIIDEIALVSTLARRSRGDDDARDSQEKPIDGRPPALAMLPALQM
jgi:hypothetical protein